MKVIFFNGFIWLQLQVLKEVSFSAALTSIYGVQIELEGVTVL